MLQLSKEFCRDVGEVVLEREPVVLQHKVICEIRSSCVKNRTLNFCISCAKPVCGPCQAVICENCIKVGNFIHILVFSTLFSHNFHAFLNTMQTFVLILSWLIDWLIDFLLIMKQAAEGQIFEQKGHISNNHEYHQCPFSLQADEW